MIERGSREWETNMDQLHRNIDDHIAGVGQSCIGVGGGEGTLPFTYTIGLQKAGLPELIVFGRYDLNDVLNHYADRMKREGAFPNGLPIPDELAKIPFVAVHCTSPATWDEYTVQAGDYKVIQLVAPDKEGRYPWDEGCAEPFSMQPVLGAAPAGKGRLQ